MDCRGYIHISIYLSLDMTSRRGAVRGELVRFFGAAPDGSPLSGPDPLPPYEDGYNRIYDLLSRGCDEITTSNSNHVQGAADTSKVSEDSQAIYELLPLILLRIFGYRPGSGWLETGADLTHRDRDALMRLVLPNGPVHNFCQYHSKNEEFVYEFPISNLPAFAQAELRGGSGGGQSLASRSALEPLIRKTLRETNTNVMFLTPMQYFELCLVSSAAQKWTELPRTGGGPRRTQKRSSSLPSVRAMYNKVIGAYAELLIVDAVLGSSGNLLLPACIDMFCLPWGNSLFAGSSNPKPSTQSVDAVSTLVLAMIPKNDSQTMVRGGSGSFSWNEMSNGTALYRAIEILLDAVFQRYNTKDPSTTFAAYVRLFALYLAPWKRSIRATMATGLFPKKRSASSAKRQSFKSTISNTYEQLKVASGVSTDLNTETAVPQDVLRNWREKVGGDRRGEEGKLLMLCTIRSANQRLAGSADGYRALALVGEAVSASGTKYLEGTAGCGTDAESEVSRRAEAKGCLQALREQSIEGESRSGMKAKPFTLIFGTALDIRVDAGGLFSGVAEKITGVPIPVSPGNPTAHTPRYVQRRKSALLDKTYVHEKVEILGSVWDRPISENENEFVVLCMFRLALYLEPYMGRMDKLRAVGRYDNMLLAAVAALFLGSTFTLIRAIL